MMTNNRTILEKSVEQGRNDRKPSRSQEDNMKDMEKKKYYERLIIYRTRTNKDEQYRK